MKIYKDKQKHSYAVAEYMYENATRYGQNPEKAYTVGLLHDIGYIHSREGHEQEGARLLGRMGMATEYTMPIMVHGTNMNTLTDRYITPMSLLLQEADMSVDKYGNRVGFDGRLKDIGRRYGYNGKEYENAKKTIEYLKSHPYKVPEREETHFGMDDFGILNDGKITTGEPLSVNGRYVVEASGYRDGLYYATIIGSNAVRCGYVGIPADNPMYKELFEFRDKGGSWYDLNVDVHGGISFWDTENTYPIRTDEDVFWLGFDCNHLYDRPSYADAYEYAEKGLLDMDSVKRHECICCGGYEASRIGMWDMTASFHSDIYEAIKNGTLISKEQNKEEKDEEEDYDR